jgi:AcrR family transcriptional regulator
MLTTVPNVPAPRRGRPPKHSRPVLLNAASRVLIERGYGGLRYRDVAESAGVPVASLQHYFPNLADLRREALLNQVHTEVRSLSADLDEIPDPWARLRHVIAATVELDSHKRKSEWMVWLEYWRAAAHDPALAEDNLREESTIRGLVQSALDDGVTAGIFHPMTDTETIAITLIAMVDGFGLRLAINDTAGDAEASVEAIESYARLILQADADLPSFQAEFSRA